MIVGGGLILRHRVILLLLLIDELVEPLEHLLTLGVEVGNLAALALDRACVFYGLEERAVLGDDLRVIEERCHEGGISALGLELCLDQAVLLLLGPGGDPNGRRDGSRGLGVVGKLSFAWLLKKHSAVVS
jgi:hypothetical protein